MAHDTTDDPFSPAAARPPRLSEAMLLALWEQARAQALRACRRTVQRLRAGQGGFYALDDLLQDLFLEFWALTRRYPAVPPAPDAPLWRAWRRLLAHGALSVLARAPQRLWRGREQPLPDMFEAAPPRVAPDAPAWLNPWPTVEAEQGRRERLIALEAAFWSLPLVQRQLLYLHALAELPLTEIARCLALPSAEAAAHRLRTARAALRRALQTEGRLEPQRARRRNPEGSRG